MEGNVLLPKKSYKEEPDAPYQAQQAIDRWYVLTNLREAVERFLSHRQKSEDAELVTPLAKNEPAESGLVRRDHANIALRSISRSRNSTSKEEPFWGLQGSSTWPSKGAQVCSSGQFSRMGQTRTHQERH